LEEHTATISDKSVNCVGKMASYIEVGRKKQVMENIRVASKVKGWRTAQMNQ
jgi:hypothetical protein